MFCTRKVKMFLSLWQSVLSYFTPNEVNKKKLSYNKQGVVNDVKEAQQFEKQNAGISQKNCIAWQYGQLGTNGSTQGSVGTNIRWADMWGVLSKPGEDVNVEPPAIFSGFDAEHKKHFR